MENLLKKQLHFMQDQNRIRVFIAFGSNLNRENLSYILNRDYRFLVVGVCGENEDVLPLAAEASPDIILLHHSAPIANGFELISKLRTQLPYTQVIIISSHSSPIFVRKAILNGTSGYLTKKSSYDELINALLEVNLGKKYICQEVKEIVAKHTYSDDGNLIVDYSSITNREVEVIDQLIKGYSTKDIADNFKISERTVSVHRHNILRKLHLKNTVALIRYMNM